MSLPNDHVTYYVPVDNTAEPETVKMSVKVFSHGTIYDILLWKKVFLKIKTLKSWDPPQCFRNMQILAAGGALAKWNHIVNTLPPPREQNGNNFDLCINQFITEYLPIDPRGYLDDALANIKLRPNESIKKFNVRFLNQADFVPLLPLENIPYSMREIMKLYKESMPPYWQSVYEDNTQKCADINQLMTYFDGLDEKKKPRSEPSKSSPYYKNKNNFNNNNNNSNYQRGNQRIRHGINSFTKNNNNDNSERPKTWCDIHKVTTHTTDHCFLNSKNTNSNKKNNNNNNNKNNKSKNKSHNNINNFNSTNDEQFFYSFDYSVDQEYAPIYSPIFYPITTYSNYPYVSDIDVNRLEHQYFSTTNNFSSNIIQENNSRFASAPLTSEIPTNTTFTNNKSKQIALTTDKILENVNNLSIIPSTIIMKEKSIIKITSPVNNIEKNSSPVSSIMEEQTLHPVKPRKAFHFKYSFTKNKNLKKKKQKVNYTVNNSQSNHRLKIPKLEKQKSKNADLNHFVLTSFSNRQPSQKPLRNNTTYHPITTCSSEFTTSSGVYKGARGLPYSPINQQSNITFPVSFKSVPRNLYLPLPLRHHNYNKMKYNYQHPLWSKQKNKHVNHSCNSLEKKQAKNSTLGSSINPFVKSKNSNLNSSFISSKNRSNSSFNPSNLFKKKIAKNNINFSTNNNYLSLTINNHNNQSSDNNFALSNTFSANNNNTIYHLSTDNNKFDPIPLINVNYDGKTLKALLDTGAVASLIKLEHLNKNTEILEATDTFSTVEGQFQTLGKANLSFLLPEFTKHRKINFPIYLCKSMHYDLILGRNFISQLKLDLSFKTNSIEWDGLSIPMKQVMNKQIYTYDNNSSTLQQAHDHQELAIDAGCEPLNIQKAVSPINNHQIKIQLQNLLNNFYNLFDGKLGEWTGTPYKLPIKENSTPYYSKPFPVPQVQLPALKQELLRLENLKIIRKDNSSPWAAPCFTIPKKNGTLRLIIDFRKLNSCLLRQPFFIPRISDLLQSLETFVCVTILDATMGYSQLPIDIKSQPLLSFAVPFGKYVFQRLPLGVSSAPDEFQARMMKILGHFNFVRVYFDDILIITTTSLDDHLNQLKLVFQQLAKANITINGNKSQFMVKRCDYLGFTISQQGIQPQQKKIQAILELKSPSNKKQLRQFIGLVNYYRDTWESRAHTMAPLTAMVGAKAKFSWSKECETAFQSVKASIASATLLVYPNYNFPFEIHTDASAFQLGGVISQRGRPLAFYSRKLTPTQQNYSIMELELLSIVEILKEFRNILLGRLITIFTDHKNLSFSDFTNQRIMRWRLIVEEYSPVIKYLEGSKNIAADAMSRLPLTEETSPHNTISVVELTDLEKDFPLNNITLEKFQQQDQTLLNILSTNPEKFSCLDVSKNIVLIDAKTNRIIIPVALRPAILEFYHTTLLHPGVTRMHATMSINVIWKTLLQDVKNYVSSCQTCAKEKKNNKNYGKIPPPLPVLEPWKEVHVGLIGPFNQTINNFSSNFDYYAITMIDAATRWIEIMPIYLKTSKNVALTFDSTWLCRYPRGTYVVHDQGTEFTGQEFQELLVSYGLISRPITVKNPQSNGVLERVHSVITNMLRTSVDLTKHKWFNALQAIAFAIRATIHTTLQASPSQLVFNRDLILNTSYSVNWMNLAFLKSKAIAKNNLKTNKNRVNYAYQVGEKVFLQKNEKNPPKLSSPTTGPYEIIKVNDNGTVIIRKGSIDECVNIRRLQPYTQEENVLSLVPAQEN